MSFIESQIYYQTNIHQTSIKKTIKACYKFRHIEKVEILIKSLNGKYLINVMFLSTTQHIRNLLMWYKVWYILFYQIQLKNTVGNITISWTSMAVHQISLISAMYAKRDRDSNILMLVSRENLDRWITKFCPCWSLIVLQNISTIIHMKPSNDTKSIK